MRNVEQFEDAFDAAIDRWTNRVNEVQELGSEYEDSSHELSVTFKERAQGMRELLNEAVSLFNDYIAED